MIIEKRLINNLNLSEDEVAVYLAALEEGEATIQDLARKSGVKRTSIYNFIDGLKQQKLILEMKKGKRKIYAAASPRKLLEMERLRLMELEQLMPRMEAIYNASEEKPRVTFYEGMSGIKQVYTDTLEEGQPIVGFSDYEYMKKWLGGKYFSYYPKERTERGITFKSVARDSEAAREIKEQDSERLRETKLISSGDLRTEINIYGNKVAMMSFRTQTPFAVLIEDKNIAETLRIAWQKLWEKM